MTPALDNPIVAFFMEYAYEPFYVYGAIIALMLASSFGLPFPEEVTLLSAGLLAHIGSNPELYPPPYAGAVGVHVGLTAFIAFLAVFLSDFLVFWLGRRFGPALVKNRFVGRILKPAAYEKITAWTTRFGPLACGIFRFTPALRLPGHFACGALGIKPMTFVLIDGIAALISVPTQVLLIAHFGQEILGVLKQVKIAIAIAVCIALAVFFFKRWQAKRSARSAAASTAGNVVSPSGARDEAKDSPV